MTRSPFALLGLVIAVAAAGVYAQSEDAVARGKQQWVAQGCYGCHTIEKVGTPIGPDLSKVGGRYPHGYLLRWLRDPSAVRPNAHMPMLELSEEQIEGLAAYLASLR